MTSRASFTAVSHCISSSGSSVISTTPSLFGAAPSRPSTITSNAAAPGAHEVVVHQRVVLALRRLLGRVEIGTRVQPVADVAVGRLLDDRHHVARGHREQLDLLRVRA